jgi:hypothetical protein
MLRLVALMRTDVSEELTASIIRVTKIGELGTMLAVTNNRSTLHSVRQLLSSSETSVLPRATWRNIPEDAILHSHRREYLESSTAFLKFCKSKIFLLEANSYNFKPSIS